MKMNKQMKTTMSLAAFAGLSLAAGSADAALLSIDFGTSTSAVESGFIGQSAASVVHSTTAGDVTVGSNGSFFKRGASGTNTGLFEDFTFLNADAPVILTLSGLGIAANTAYDFKFWSYDSNNGGATHSQSYAGTSGTVGSAGPIVYPAGGNPSSLDSFSASGTFTSNGSGVLTISLTDVPTSGTPSPRLNGFEISAVPEPSTTALLGLGGLALILRRRK